MNSLVTATGIAVLVSGCGMKSGLGPLGPSGRSSSTYVTLPPVLALTEVEARAAIKGAGFDGELRVTRDAACRGAPLGHACWTVPQVGAKVLSDRTVELGIQSKPATILADCSEAAPVAVKRCEDVNAEVDKARAAAP